jgi:hypothetical protein
MNIQQSLAELRATKIDVLYNWQFSTIDKKITILNNSTIYVVEIDNSEKIGSKLTHLANSHVYNLVNTNYIKKILECDISNDKKLSIQIAENKKVLDYLKKIAEKQLNELFSHELNNELNGNYLILMETKYKRQLSYLARTNKFAAEKIILIDSHKLNLKNLLKKMM